MQITRINLNKLDTLISRLKDKQFDVSTQYKFLLLSKEITKEKQIYDEQLSALLDKYGEKDDNGGLVTSDNGGIALKSETISECQEQFKKLNELLIQLPDLFFSLDELSELKLTLGELELLDPFIKS